MRLNRAMIFVTDLDRMTAFYREVLGLKVIEETRLENYVEFDTGGSTFALHTIPGAARCESPSFQPRERTPIKLSFQVDDSASTRRNFEALGVMILERPWGGWDAVDPEGNVFGVYSTAGQAN